MLELSGWFVLGGSKILEEKLQSLICGGRLALLLDCSQVAGIDAQGIGTLIQAVKSVEKRSGKLKLLTLVDYPHGPCRCLPTRKQAGKRQSIQPHAISQSNSASVL